MKLSVEQMQFLADRGLSIADVIEFASMAGGRSAAAVRQANYRERGGGKIPEELRASVFDRDGWACLDCGAEDNLCCDHVIPVSKGGETQFENLQTLCRPCNSKKKDRIRKRDVRRVRGMSAETSGGNAETPPPNSPPNDIYSNPPLNPPTKSKSARGSRLPDDWFPQPLPANLAASVSAWPAGKQERELARFRDWAASATGPNAVKNDWDAAWRNWLRKADDDQGKTGNGGHSRHERSTTRQTGERVAARFAARSGGPADQLLSLSPPGRDD